MEKLIELLNEREKTVNGVQHPGRCKEHLEYQCHGPRVINKRFGFIKWLVENDKIDTQNLITYMNGTSLTFNKVPSTDCASIDKTWNNFYTECLLMLLSISDTPIEDLISLLK